MDFLEQALALDFKDQPDYDQLKLTLELVIIEQNADLANLIEDEIPTQNALDGFKFIKNQTEKYGELPEFPNSGGLNRIRNIVSWFYHRFT